MLENLHLDAPPSMSSLVGGIISDMQNLVRQEMALARREIQEEVQKAKQAAIVMVIGAGVAAVGTILACFTFVYLLNWATSDGIPLWGCYAIVGVVFLVVGAGLINAGRLKAGNLRLVPQQTAETLKENVQWIRNQT